ncbi:MAG: DUF4349 domain-containing protein [Mycobacteriales bacterium]
MTNSMLDDEVLTGLLGEAAESFPVPGEGPGFVLEESAVNAPRVGRGRVLKWTAIAAAVAAGVLVVQSFGGGGNGFDKSQLVTAPSSAGGVAGTTGGGATGATTGSSGTAGGGSFRSSMDAVGDARTRDLAGTKSAVPGALPPIALHPTASGSGGAAEVPQGAYAPGTKAPAAGVGDGFSDSAKIVKTGSIALIVGDGKVSSVVVKVHAIASGARGYVSDEKSQEYGDDPTSTVTIRVPVDKFESVVQAVRDQVKNGVGKIDSSSTSGQDVTAAYADVAAQIQSLTAARNRFLTILERANTIGETLSVQQRVDSVQQQIDSLKGRLRVLADRTSLATLTVTVSEKPKAERKPHVQSGLSKSFDNAKDGFTSGVESLISKSGKGLLVLILAAIGLVILRTGWRLARRRLV